MVAHELSNKLRLERYVVYEIKCLALVKVDENTDAMIRGRDKGGSGLLTTIRCRGSSVLTVML